MEHRKFSFSLCLKHVVQSTAVVSHSLCQNFQTDCPPLPESTLAYLPLRSGLGGAWLLEGSSDWLMFWGLEDRDCFLLIESLQSPRRPAANRKGHQQNTQLSMVLFLLNYETIHTKSNRYCNFDNVCLCESASFVVAPCVCLVQKCVCLCVRIVCTCSVLCTRRLRPGLHGS